MCSFLSTSQIRGPAPLEMKIGSRPIARIARTGELTPPGSSSRARRYSSLERVVSVGVDPPRGFPPRVLISPPDITSRLTARASRSLNARVLAFPVPVLLGEVQQADLLELGRGVERGAFADSGVLGDRVEDRVAFLLRAAVRHREDRVGPVGVRRPLVAVRDAPEGRHP